MGTDIDHEVYHGEVSTKSRELFNPGILTALL